MTEPVVPDIRQEAPPQTTEETFARAHPGHADTEALDELRRSDFARLDASGHVYLDYTGAGLYADSVLNEHLELLRSNVFGNPHSLNPTSAAMTELVERARAAVLAFFSASPDEYVAIFTPNATGALRLVGEAYLFRTGDRFLLSFDNHNSVNGIREFARARGAETTYVPSVAPALRVDESLLARYLTEVAGEHHNLFAHPAQSNFSGVQHPLDWIEQAHGHGWDVLLDAAAYVPTPKAACSVSRPATWATWRLIRLREPALAERSGTRRGRLVSPTDGSCPSPGLRPGLIGFTAAVAGETSCSVAGEGPVRSGRGLNRLGKLRSGARLCVMSPGATGTCHLFSCQVAKAGARAADGCLA